MKILFFITLIFSIKLFASTSIFLDHDLKVSLYPQTGEIFVHDTLENFLEHPHTFQVPANIFNLSLECNGEAVNYIIVSKNNDVMTIILGDISNDCNALEISYIFKPEIEFNGEESSALILPQGVYLSPSSYWYPSNGSLYESFELTVSLPENWRSMTTGTLKKSELSGGLRIEKWSTNDYSEPIFLIANQFDVNRVSYRGVSLETYFLKGLEGYSAIYLEKLKSIIDIYMNYFGYYPYDKFAVVSNFFSTGYGMASYTLLDKNIIPFPFIVARSLGHEFLHNYWGNSVYVTRDEGNWCEGLTSFQADYHFAELESAQKAYYYRRDELRDYQNSVNSRNVFPLKDFKFRYDSASKSIGYGKALMVFYMLQNRLGANVFNRAMVRFASEFKFKYASWSDIQGVLEEESGSNLINFFHNWINEIEIIDLDLKWKENILTIVQKGKVLFDVNVPVEISYNGKKELRYFFINKKKHSFILGIIPSKIKLDPKFSLMRIISEQENAPTLKKFWGQEDIEYRYSYSMNANELNGVNAAIKSHPGGEGELKFSELAEETILSSRSYYFILPGQLEFSSIKEMIKRNEFSISNGLIKINDEEFSLDEHVLVIATTLGSETTVLQSGPAGDSIARVARKVAHYGGNGLLLFKLDGRKVVALKW